MSISPLATAWPPRTRSINVVREHEILRISAMFFHDSTTELAHGARCEVLAWAQRRCGGTLPDSAWMGHSFEYLSGGRTTLATRLIENGSDIWSLRADEPDKTVPGRIWTTEVTIGFSNTSDARLSVRQFVNSSELQLDIGPHVPGFMQQLTIKFKIQIDDINVDIAPIYADSETEIETLIELIVSDKRMIPVFVSTGDERSNDWTQPLIDVDSLSKATLGIAHNVIVPAHLTYALSDAFGKRRSVYHGGIRAYMPGFDIDSDPYKHPLFISDNIRSSEDAIFVIKSLRELAAKESLFRLRLDIDVLTFSSVRSAALQIESQRKVESGASDAERLSAAQKQILALEDALSEAKDLELQIIEWHDEAEERARTAESELRAQTAQLQRIISQNRELGINRDDDLTPPSTWSEFSDWVDQNLSARVALTPAARKCIKKTDFIDIALAARCLIWLANDCRDLRMEGGGSLFDASVENGIWNSLCGGDAYKFSFQGRTIEADWHVKSGGNTHDPKRCLRIYYGWDENTQQIVIDRMPSHLETAAS